MLRKIVLEHDGQRYEGTIRNISTTGAMIEGLWNVPAGTLFRVVLTRDYAITATARWSKDDRMGVEFAEALETGEDGRISVRPQRRARSAEDIAPPALRKAS